MTIYTCNDRTTPKTHMKPYISRLVSIYGTRWKIYHVLLVKLRRLYCHEIPFLGPKMGVKVTICTSNVRKTPKTHMKPDISRLVLIYRIHWNIYHMLLFVKLRNFYCPRNTLFVPLKWWSKWLLASSNARKTPKTHMKPYISRLVSILWNTLGYLSHVVCKA